ncbi:hypothetical protein [Geodermatophilus sp. DSM 45219]|uniref:hypothetical protein n=1 Tax=Geodermatophilus sp. DSM 45219 TaxID=1881103 RepID=UPI0008848A5A|nr:hypothetical protein [Geodermatophilus sp. DSM 45219]SDN46790.1 hypothetical protein SAMN05428965_0520 [Geodermatophilus sp. DSM 45219]
MRPTVLEGRVLQAVDALRKGITPEDDLTECKARWPEKTTARQLAGLCNKAAGEPVVYIIGVHDRTGAIMDPGPVDPADWWAGMRGQFDQTPPDVLTHLSIAVGDGEFVHAWAFDTSRAPFVVKSDGSKLEVPIRDGTSTRSAHRHELLRMLLPQVTTPPSSLLLARLSATWRGAEEEGELQFGRRRPATPESATITGDGKIFVEHVGPAAIMLPAHGMKARIHFADQDLGIRIGAGSLRIVKEKKQTAAHGIEIRDDGVVVTGAGLLPLLFRGDLPLELMAVFESAIAATLKIELAVVGSNRPIRLDAHLRQQPASSPERVVSNVRSLNRFGSG